MADKSKIEWTEATWNPVLGCDKISPGCKNCYAIRTAWRLQHNPNPKVAKAFEGLTVMQGGQPNWTGRVNFIDDRLQEPLRWKEARKIFVNSQSDLFHEGISFEQIDQVFAVMGHCSAKWYRCTKPDCEHESCDENRLQLREPHVFQVLTKRPGRALEYLSAPNRHEQIKRAWNLIGWYFGDHAPINHSPWPLSNVWLGVSCENQATADERIPLLLQTPAAVRWVSAEPLQGEIDLSGFLWKVGCEPHCGDKCCKDIDCPIELTEKLHWVVAGGESGPKARPMHPDWARSLRDQCQAASVPFFFKQWGEWGPCGAKEEFKCKGERHVYPVHKFADENHVVRRGKKAAGRLLDGKEWNQYPRSFTECSHGKAVT